EGDLGPGWYSLRLDGDEHLARFRALLVVDGRAEAGAAGVDDGDVPPAHAAVVRDIRRPVADAARPRDRIRMVPGLEPADQAVVIPRDHLRRPGEGILGH